MAVRRATRSSSGPSSERLVPVAGSSISIPTTPATVSAVPDHCADVIRCPRTTDDSSGAATRVSTPSICTATSEP
ncbi:hypothetical protein [Streptomyces sp. NPDC057257]|uniref:hypothetical protein n=1 Tax=Streptomyces sp. NPDC057257 TaxID=3346071 RepID=UPI003643DC5A